MNPLRKDLVSTPNFTALLCIESQELLETATGQLTPLGFEVHTVSTPEQALSHLYSHFYDVLVLSDSFGDGTAETHPVLAQLASVPLNLRRKLFVVLIGPKLTPHSQAQAFGLSVDLVIRPQDVANLKVLVGQGVLAQQEFYAAFHEVERLMRKEG
jgi:CheY-like chemotaxis protein